MKGRNKKGFTLVELLASLVILGLLTAVAAPNIIGILSSTKTETYVTDANKLRTLAEYKIRSGNSIERPSRAGECIFMTMKYLGTSEFKKPPYGGTYQDDRSFVVICRENVTVSGTTTEKYVYYTQLIEKIEDPSVKYSGIQLRKNDNIKSDKVNGSISSPVKPTSGTATLTTVDGKPLSIIVKGRYTG
ncbi:MAG: prepilin-type N-terminal cleavage/methylation domain-containing protein [Bacilli bacterium]|nr:prepilin-type N-terminal cleavage/methylation domain-containing protein [Bacilli bacterium]